MIIYYIKNMLIHKMRKWQVNTPLIAKLVPETEF